MVIKLLYTWVLKSTNEITILVQSLVSVILIKLGLIFYFYKFDVLFLCSYIYILLLKHTNWIHKLQTSLKKIFQTKNYMYKVDILNFLKSDHQHKFDVVNLMF